MFTRERYDAKRAMAVERAKVFDHLQLAQSPAANACLPVAHENRWNWEKQGDVTTD